MLIKIYSSILQYMLKKCLLKITWFNTCSITCNSSFYLNSGLYLILVLVFSYVQIHIKYNDAKLISFIYYNLLDWFLNIHSHICRKLYVETLVVLFVYILHLTFTNIVRKKNFNPSNIHCQCLNRHLSPLDTLVGSLQLFFLSFGC